MEFLRLNSNSSNFSVDKNILKWELPNLEFSQNTKVAVSEIVVFFQKRPKEKFIMITTNLINSGENNPDGTVLAKRVDGFGVEYIPNHLIFWPIDYQRPRIVEFTINGLDNVNLDFISILVCIQNASGVMVSK